MKMQIKEFAGFTGVSVRTLHYYDEIGLLKPAFVDRSTSYRYYDESSLLRMQEILFYRELDFSLKDIQEILSSPNYDKQTALQEQKKLLTLKKERLERLIVAIDGATKGENVMSAFDNKEFDQYKTEAQKKWGKTDAYQEYSKRTKNHSQSDFQRSADGLNAVFAEFSLCMQSGEKADSEAAQALVMKLQTYITNNYYTCTREILAGLGQMYVMDERFKENIDKNGEGTAQFASDAIRYYSTR
jgi:DNA-binding transcriptional MerR regulator